jgi:hypothetical protein
MNNLAKAVLAAGILLTLAACAAGTNEAHQAVSGGIVSQFVVGFWHGLIAPVTLIVEVVNKVFPRLLPIKWRLYETSGATVAYDVGFYLGLAGGPSVFLSRRRRWW